MYCPLFQKTDLFLGNKSDLEGKREVPFSVAEDLADHYGMLDAIETSAKENCNVEAAFVKMAKVIYFPCLNNALQ